jgi:hypothetical protein
MGHGSAAYSSGEAVDWPRLKNLMVGKPFTPKRSPSSRCASASTCAVQMHARLSDAVHSCNHAWALGAHSCSKITLTRMHACMHACGDSW